MGESNAGAVSGPVLVSVVIPAWNAKKYLAAAVTSVLRQSDAVSSGISLEILIIDDCSSDGTLSLAERMACEHPDRIRVFHNDADIGAAETRNVGIRAARGKYIAFLDADDWWADGKLIAQVQLLEKTGAVLCGTGRELMCPDGTSAGRIIGMPARVSYRQLLRGNVISCSSVVMRADAAKRFGMERDDLHEDYILWLRVLKAYGDAVGIDAPLLKYRLSEGGKSRNKTKSARMTYGVYRYLGFGRLRSIRYFLQYAVHGVMKYYG